MRRFLLLAPLSLLGLGCPANSTPDVVGTTRPDSAQMRRLTPEQLRQSVRVLFPSVFYSEVLVPGQIETNGFNNDTAVNTVTPATVDAYYELASLVSDAVAQDPTMFGCGATDTTCLRRAMLKLAARGWRRPLTAEEAALVGNVFDETVAEFGLRSAVSLVVQLVLQAPDFLYVAEPGVEARPFTSWEMASRLSLVLWGGPPDQELFRRAEADQLRTKEQVAAEAWRMLGDRRAREGLLGFYRQFLQVEDVSVVLDLEKYFGGEFIGEDIDTADYLHLLLQPQMKAEIELFVLNRILRGPGTLSDLLTATDTHVTPSLQWVYERSNSIPVEGEDFFAYSLDPAQRSGVLTLSGMVHARAKPGHTSPILRGVFVMERFLCNKPPPPPNDVPPVEDTAQGPIRTNRDRYAAHTVNPACQGCHAPIDGIGFTFENYDALGRFQTEENGVSIDATGELIGTDIDRKVSGAVELSKALASSRTAHDCHVEQWFRYAFARSVAPEDTVTLRFLQDGFWASGGDIPLLLVNLVSSHAFRNKG